MTKKEDVISLNPQFLNFLMSPEKSNTASKQFNEALNLLASQNLRQFDPFDKVVLSHKGIDNPILTSFRTLAKTNNSLSDTFKIIHNKFLPNDETRKSAFFQSKKADGQNSKSYLMNPPPDLSLHNPPAPSDIPESPNRYSSTIGDQNLPLNLTNIKISTAEGQQRNQRLRLNDSLDKIQAKIAEKRSSLIKTSDRPRRAQRGMNVDISQEEIFDGLNDASVVLPE